MAITLVHDCDIERLVDPTAYPGDAFKDSHMSAEFPDTNYGVYYDMTTIGLTGGEKEIPEVVDGIVLFDLTKFLPASATITSAVWWFNTRNNFTGPEMEWWVARCGRTDWLEDEVTWNVYSTGNTWAVAGGDRQGTPAPISLGLLDTAGWYNKDITAMVTDAWSNRGGICTFVVYRDDDDMLTVGYVNIVAKEYRDQSISLPHHLRVTYTLDGKTFQAHVH